MTNQNKDLIGYSCLPGNFLVVASTSIVSSESCTTIFTFFIYLTTLITLITDSPISFKTSYKSVTKLISQFQSL